MALQLTSEDLGKETLLLRAQGAIDLTNMSQWEEAMRRVIRRRATSVLVDLSELNHISARGLKMLMPLAANQSLLNGCLIVVGASASMQRAARQAGLWKVAGEAASMRAALRKADDYRGAQEAGEKMLKEARAQSRRLARQAGAHS